ncbi:Di-trans-poly-cis-decaprenylcistransferase [Lactarius akahatsu]|uniref:Alkyl transferase n=1 Tax=Lactarius akahatsu TaxID=416441 RepID=A0AAD4LB43_9AGAM|nr:Di-trans-poly-cis-decaprenylcistransferase [Lactarius akahatsu]
MPFSSSTNCQWLSDQIIDSLRHGSFAVLREGPIPQHVAFVMDGNRRHARTHGTKVLQGHVDGFAALKKVLEISFALEIKFVSVYAFSIDNFKRPKEEVDGLMHLCKTDLLDLCTPGGLLAQHEARLNTVGKTNLFPPEVQAALAKAEELTKDYHRGVLNLCVAYSSRDEIATAVEETLQAASLEGRTKPFTERDIEDRLMTTKVNSPPPDILIRTSGVKRLSDFLLWQCTDNTQIHFIDVFWPEIGMVDILPIILEYQRKIWSQ